ncbi:PP2C family protein-serine/threonine phosphatase [Actinacidiphila glaucinigra]|uniref:PP2C family protein-serine/threonine phosphatase n=1 Tax=Actinacidiphila glaucinigra TaxID=235986 RepID=UPI0033AED013
MKDSLTHRLRRLPGRRAAPHGSGRGPSWVTLLTQGHGPLALALFMIISIVVTGFILPPTEHLASLMVVVPATTAVLAGPGTTTLSAALSCVAAFVLDVHDNLLGTSIPAVHQLEILLVSAFVIASRSIRDRSVRELTEVRIVSDTIQRVLLRPLPPRIGPLLVRATYHASHPYAQIGGDLYAVARSAAGVRFLIGDVKGKGLPAVEDAEALLGAFRGAARRFGSLPELVADLEHSIRGHFEETGRTDSDAVERFITALVLEVPDDCAEIHMVNCGHPPPYMAQRSGTLLLSPATPSPPLGLGSLDAGDYVVDTFPFGREATLLLYTDGAIEARNDDGQFYDLGAHVATWPGSRPEELLQHVLDGLSLHVGGGAIKLDDDIAMIAVQYGDGFPSPSPAPSDERLLTS